MIKQFIKDELENWQEMDEYEKTDFVFYLIVLVCWMVILTICLIAQFA